MIDFFERNQKRRHWSFGNKTDALKVVLLNFSSKHGSSSLLHWMDNKIPCADEHSADYVLELWKAHKHTVRKPSVNVVNRRGWQVDEQSVEELVHRFEPQLNIRLALSFVDCSPISESQFQFQRRSPELYEEYQAKKGEYDRKLIKENGMAAEPFGSDFSKIKTTDDLLLILPPEENDRWEFKSALKLVDQNRFSSELGKQVSAFANSGGGNLVIGINDKTRDVEPCERIIKGRQSTKDWLSTKVESSVDYPIRHFRVHEIPCAIDQTKSIYVVEVDDSPAAPHQAKEDRVYYYRTDGHSKPAPHFHVELLCNRVTKAVLEIEEISHHIANTQFHMVDRNGVMTKIHFGLHVKVRNVSLQSTENWGIHIEKAGDPLGISTWKANHTPLGRGICQRGTPATLLPDEMGYLNVDVVNSIETPAHSAQNMAHHSEVKAQWGVFGVLLRPVSHNYLGEHQFYGWNDSEEKSKAAVAAFCEQLRRGGQMIAL